MNNRYTNLTDTEKLEIVKRVLFAAYRDELRRWQTLPEKTTSEYITKLRSSDRAMALWVVILEAELEDEYEEWFEQNRKPYEIRL